jgi:hypothetical protein
MEHCDSLYICRRGSDVAQKVRFLPFLAVTNSRNIEIHPRPYAPLPFSPLLSSLFQSSRLSCTLLFFLFIFPAFLFFLPVPHCNLQQSFYNWSKKLVVSNPVCKFPAPYGNRRTTAFFTRTHHKDPIWWRRWNRRKLSHPVRFKSTWI